MATRKKTGVRRDVRFDLESALNALKTAYRLVDRALVEAESELEEARDILADLDVESVAEGSLSDGIGDYVDEALDACERALYSHEADGLVADLGDIVERAEKLLHGKRGR